MTTMLDDVSGMTVATESNSFLLKRQMQGKLLESKGNEGQQGGSDEFTLLQYEDLRKSVRDLEKQVSFVLQIITHFCIPNCPNNKFCP